MASSVMQQLFLPACLTACLGAALLMVPSSSTRSGPPGPIGPRLETALEEAFALGEIFRSELGRRWRLPMAPRSSPERWAKERERFMRNASSIAALRARQTELQARLPSLKAGADRRERRATAELAKMRADPNHLRRRASQALRSNPDCADARFEDIVSWLRLRAHAEALEAKLVRVAYFEWVLLLSDLERQLEARGAKP